MRVIYEDLAPGVSVELEQVKLLSKQDRPKYNRRGRYLYSEISYRFSATYNPASTSAKYINQSINTREGYNPFVTEEALRYWLEQPRKRFKWLDDESNEVLVVPRADYSTDAHNGPLPTVLSATEVVGSGTICVEWMVTVHLNEITKFSETPILLEHEWEAHHDIDDRYFTTRVLSGRVDFNTEYLEKNNFSPDDYRQHLFPPPPNGYKRIKVDVTAQEDGSSLIYTVVDREQRCSLKRRGIAKVELVQSGGSKAVGWSEVAVGAYSTLYSISQSISNVALQAAMAIVTGGSSTATQAEVTAATSSAASSASGLFGQIGSAAYSFIKNNQPIRFTTLFVRVFGTPETPFDAIKSAAYEIASFRIGRISRREFLRNVDITETHIVHEGVVELSISQISNIGDQTISLIRDLSVFTNGPLVAGAAIGGAAFSNVTSLVAPNDDIEPSIGEWSYQAPVPGASTTPTDNGSRGTSLAAVVTQSLADATDKPQKSSSRLRNRRSTQDPQS